MKKYESNKLFYKQYTYKLVLRFQLANWFRGGELPYIRETLDELQRQYNQNKQRLELKLWNRTIHLTVQELHQSQKIYSALCNSADYRLRVEGKHLSLYSNDKDWLESIIKDVGPVAEEWWEPSSIMQPSTIKMGSSLQGWEYRITLGSNVPKSAYTWLRKNIDKIRVGPVFKKSLLDEHPYATGFYFYVKNSKMLSLATLVFEGSISSIDKIIIEDKDA